MNYAITGDPRCAVASGITAGLFYGAGELYPGNAYAHAVAGTAGGGIGAAITGGDIGRGMIVGGISGFSGTYFGSDYGIIGRSFIGGCTGGAAALIYGGNFGEGFKQGALIAGSAVIYNEWSHWMQEARQNRQMTNEFFSSIEGKVAKWFLGKLTPSVPTAVAATAGTVTFGQAAKSILRPGLSGIRGIPTLGGVSGTIGSAALTTGMATVGSYGSWKFGLYFGSYIEALPALFK